MNLTILIPAHNEEDVLEAAVRSLMIQTFHWNRLVVVADNCTDSTVGLAESLGCDVFQTVGNIHMKAGALNQALAHILPSLEDEDMVFVMDADGVLDPHFLENAAERLMNERLLGAVGGNFDGMSGGGVVGYLQRNEYSRYKRDTRRLRGKCLVVTGTAALFKVDTLRNVSHARLAGVLPVGDSKGGVYDTSVLTEDNELSFALLHLGYKILSPADCVLLTEVMPTWKKLWNQRLRWKRGAIENCFQYGFTKVTWRYWGRQLMSILGIAVTFLYLASLGVTLLTGGSVHMSPFWMAITGVFVLERVVTVRDRGWVHMLLAATMVEVLYDLFLQLVHTKAYADAMFSKKRSW